MKKLMLVCGLMLGAATITFAQGGGQGRGMQMKPEDQTKQMQTALKLTDDQTAKVMTIYTMMAAKRDSMMKAGADRAAMRPLNQEANTKIQALLTDEQKEAYKKMMAERMNRGGGGGGGGGMGGGGGTPPPPPAK